MSCQPFALADTEIHTKIHTYMPIMLLCIGNSLFSSIRNWHKMETAAATFLCSNQSLNIIAFIISIVDTGIWLIACPGSCQPPVYLPITLQHRLPLILHRNSEFLSLFPLLFIDLYPFKNSIRSIAQGKNRKLKWLVLFSSELCSKIINNDFNYVNFCCYLFLKSLID